MTRREAVRSIMSTVRVTDLVVVSLGYLCRDVYHRFDRSGNFYMVGSMGNAYGLGIGLALCTKRRVVVISGDGAALMNLGSLALGHELKLRNLFHYIIDNRCYESTGGQPTCSPSFDFSQFFNTTHIKVSVDSDRPLPRVSMTPRQIKRRFYQEVARNGNEYEN